MLHSHFPLFPTLQANVAIHSEDSWSWRYVTFSPSFCYEEMVGIFVEATPVYTGMLKNWRVCHHKSLGGILRRSIWEAAKPRFRPV